LKAKGEGRLEQEPRLPGYRKREGRRLPIIFVRFDNYEVDLKKKRRLTRPGTKQGRLIITYDLIKKRWYARVSVRVLLERERVGGLKAGVDLGREVLAAVAIEGGCALLYRGGPLRSNYFLIRKKRFRQSMGCCRAWWRLTEPFAGGEEEAYDKRGRRRGQTFANLAARMARELAGRSVGIVFVGYPRSIAHEKAGKGNTNAWGYKKLA